MKYPCTTEICGVGKCANVLDSNDLPLAAQVCQIGRLIDAGRNASATMFACEMSTPFGLSVVSEEYKMHTRVSSSSLRSVMIRHGNCLPNAQLTLPSRLARPKFGAGWTTKTFTCGSSASLAAVVAKVLISGLHSSNLASPSRICCASS